MKKIVKSVTLSLALALSAGLSLNGSGAAAAEPPVCSPYCVTIQCTQHSDCSPGGKCNFACPGAGCCVYD